MWHEIHPVNYTRQKTSSTYESAIV